MRRREFIIFLSGAVASPLAARAQRLVTPVIGFLSAREASEAPQLLTAFRQGLKELGFVESQNIAIEYRFAGNQNDQLPALAADLVQRQVTVIVAVTTGGAGGKGGNNDRSDRLPNWRRPGPDRARS